jgi:hypothetical protein
MDSGSKFTGQFKSGLRSGFGEWLHQGKNYRGEWRNNMMDGHGTMEWGGSMSMSQNMNRKSSLKDDTSLKRLTASMIDTQS